MSKHNNDLTRTASLNREVAKIDDSEYLHKLWDFSNAVASLDTGRIKTPQEMEERIQQLFQVCSDRGMMPTYESIAVACGIPSRTFYDMKNGEFERIQGILANNQKSKRANCYD